MKKITILFLLIFLLTSCKSNEPTIKLTPGIDTIPQFSNYTPSTCMLETKDGTYQMEIKNNIDTSILTTQTIHYTFTYDNIDYSCQRKVFIVDESKPIVSINPGVDTITVNEEWTDMSVSYSDSSNGILTLTVDSLVDTSKVGTYLVTYTVTDASANEAKAIRYVHVVPE